MAPPGQSSSQPLPGKELGLFKKIIKSYESKQYRFGLKYAKTILSNPQFSEHGETLSMKGLILSCMGKHEEALECVKKGLTSDLKSYVCWHVYGLVQRADKKYDEAIKAYKNALRMDKDNLQILRDLSLLQIQIRDYDGYKESRYHLLRLRPTQKLNWIGYATSYHLLKEYDRALDIIAEFINSNQPNGYDYEHSELLIYQNMILREAGRTSDALERLEECSAQIVDKIVYMETRGDLLMQLGRLDDAQRVWRQLVDRNPENTLYYRKLEECMACTGEARLALYDELAKKHSRAAAPKRQPLYFVEGDELRRRLTEWVATALRKGIPSLFKNLVPLYSDSTKVALIESILLDFVRKVDDNGYKNASLEGSADSIESPSTALWLYLLVAQHYDRIGQVVTALKYADKALTHTPTLIETYMIKAKIYKHAGDFSGAARMMDEAQSLDTADRYINSKCSKYMLRAGMLDEAEKMCSKFTRDEVKEGERASVTLNDMQCMWWELETARAYRKMSKYGEALRKAHQMEQHFVGMVEDQFDFHTYCLRKMTLSSYIQLLRLEDVLRRHPYYYQGAKLAIKIYLRMLDRPGDMNACNGIEENMSAAEKKRLKKKLKREKEREEETKKNKKDEKDPSMHFDPEALLSPKDPLEEAAKFAQPLHMMGCQKVTGYTLCFEVYLRKNKVLLMLKCLREAAKIDSNDPLLHIARVKFLLHQKTASYSGIVENLAKELQGALFPHTDPVKLNEEFKQKNINSFIHRLAVAECNLLLDPAAESSTKNWLLKSLDDDKLSGRTLRTMVKLYDGVQYGRYGSWTKEEVDSLYKLAHKQYPQSQTFGGGSSLPDMKELPDECHHSFE